FVCPFCGGDGEAPDTCRRCDGRGSFGPKGPQRIISPCMSCGGNGINFPPCRTCGGKGWHRSR
ncbi:MAG: molecular chaperone DnaJ, partial [Planctomycetota bacterium]